MLKAYLERFQESLKTHPPLPQPVESKPWVVIGLGPVGAMQILLLATLFPGQKIVGFDRHRNHVRRHGLQIWNETIKEIIKILNELEKIAWIKTGATDPAISKHYELVQTRIQSTIIFLKDKMMGTIIGPFIRTYQISEMLRNYAKDIAKEDLELRLDEAITKEQLEQLKVNPQNNDLIISVSNDSLQNASVIFIADGSHSLGREILFDENDEKLNKEILSHLLEIKLEMKNEINFIKDQFNRSIKPSLTGGTLYFWNQSKDGTATLRIFVNKQVFDAIKGKKDKNGKPLGEFTNPYRRLSELPKHLRIPLEETLVKVVGENQFKYETIKITAIPLHVYQAREMIKNLNGKLVFLTGDAATGLILAHGFNNGLVTATELASALFKDQHNKKEAQVNPHEFSSLLPYQEFKNRQYQMLDQILEDIAANISIEHQEKVNQTIIDFRKAHQRILTLLPTDAQIHFNHYFPYNLFEKFSQWVPENEKNNFHILVTSKCKNLASHFEANREIRPQLFAAETNVLMRTDLKITKIKKQIRFIHSQHRSVGQLVCVFEKAKPADKNRNPNKEKVALELSLKTLKQLIPHFDLTDELQKNIFSRYASWLFQLDRLYLRLKEQVDRFKNFPDDHDIKITLEELIQKTIIYVAVQLDVAKDGDEKNRAATQYKVLTQRLSAPPSKLGGSIFNHPLSGVAQMANALATEGLRLNLPQLPSTPSNVNI